MGVGIVAIYVILAFAISFFAEVGRKSKLYARQTAVLKALLISMLTTINTYCYPYRFSIVC